MINFNSNDVSILSDTHLGHANIIKYCNRPFKSVDEMNDTIIAAILENDRQGKILIHLGDVMFKGKRDLPKLKNAEHNIVVMGNHDDDRVDYSPWFGTIIGKPGNWRSNREDIRIDGELYTLSHNPQKDLPKESINLHGHVHNAPYDKLEYFLNSTRDKEIHFIFDNDAYANCCVEMLGYKPRDIDYILNDVPVPTRK